jgi:hypothetical protein
MQVLVLHSATYTEDDFKVAALLSENERARILELSASDSRALAVPLTRSQGNSCKTQLEG